jgi:hypothetical protein
VIFPTLNSETRQRIELTILSIPEAVASDRREISERVRNRLLGCLTEEHIVTDEARRLLEELTTKDGVPANEPPFRLETTWGGPYGEEEYLKDQGVPVEAEVNRRIRELEEPATAFASNHLNSTPSLEEINSVVPALRALHDGLTRANEDGVHPKQADHAWGNLAGACARIARNEALSPEEEPGTVVRNILIEASYHPIPIHDPGFDSQFDNHPSWGGPAARIEAAEGLIILAGWPDRRRVPF